MFFSANRYEENCALLSKKTTSAENKHQSPRKNTSKFFQNLFFFVGGDRPPCRMSRILLLRERFFQRIGKSRVLNCRGFLFNWKMDWEKLLAEMHNFLDHWPQKDICAGFSLMWLENSWKSPCRLLTGEKTLELLVLWYIPNGDFSGFRGT